LAEEWYRLKDLQRSSEPGNLAPIAVERSGTKDLAESGTGVF